MPKQKSARAQRPADSRFGFAKPVFQPQAAALPTVPVIQAKLKVGESDDKFEKEADQVADDVVTSPGFEAHGSALAGIASLSVQRMCTECEEDEKLQRMPSNAPTLPRISALTGPFKAQPAPHPEATGRADATVPPSLEQSINRARGGGMPLPGPVRGFLEPRFGRDLSGVRIHTDQASGELAQGLGSRAFTVGSDLFFAPGEFKPRTSSGLRVLSHELTHAVQQGAIPTADAQAPGPRVSTGAEGAVQRDLDPKKIRPSRRLTELAETAIDELDDDQSSKVLLASVLSAAKLGELPAFTAILKSKPHETFGDYFIFLVSELEQGLGSKNMVGILKLFAGAGVDVTKQLPSYSLEPLAAVAKFKSVVQQYRSLLNSGKVSEADKQRVDKLIEEAETALRGIESPPRKAGVQVKQMGGVAAVASAAWTAAAFLAADDATVIGVADDVLIPFVVIGAAILTGIATLTGGYKPEILDYRPAKEKVDAALALIILLLAYAQRPRPKPETTAEPIPVPTTPTEEEPRRKCPFPTGRTVNDPIPIQWFKPRLDRFYPKTVEVRYLGHPYFFDRDGGETRLPRGEPFGVSESRWPARDKKVRLKYWTGRRAESDRYRGILTSYGYSRSGLQIDHVQDPQWGLLNADLSGDELDVWSNLWPLSQDLNASAGGRQNNNQLVNFCEEPYGQPRKNISVAQLKAENRYGLYFVIRRIDFVSPD